MLYGDAGTCVAERTPLTADRDPVPEDVAQFAQEAYLYTLMEDMLRSMPLLDFEVRRRAARVC